MNNNRPFFQFTLLVCLLTGLNGMGQGFYTTAPPFSTFNAVGRYTDNSYAVTGSAAGSPRLQKITASGQLLWNTNAGLGNGKAIDVAVAPDGTAGVLAQYYNNQYNAVSGVNAAGTTLWVTPLPNASLPNGLNHIAAADDGSFFVAGSTHTLTGSLGVRLVKIASNGNITWDLTFENTGTDEQCSGIVLLPDGSVGVGGISRSGTETDFFLKKITADGSVAWQNIYPLAGRQVAYDLTITDDGHIALAGYQLLTNPTQICILKASSGNGALLWNRTFFLEGGLKISGAPDVSAVAENITCDQNGHFFLTVVSGSLNNSNGQLLHLDPDGWMIDLAPLPALRAINDIMADDNGGLVLAGATNSGEGLLVKSSTKGSTLPNQISGGMYGDIDGNCAFSNNEPLLSGWVIEAQLSTGEKWFTATDAFGRYNLWVGSGDFKIVPHSPTGAIAFWTPCDTIQVSLAAGSTNAVNVGFAGIKPATNCPLMEVDIQTGIIQPCVQNTWQVKYVNSGAETAPDVVITVEKSPFAEYVSSSIPLSSQTGNTLTFNTGLLQPGGGGSFFITMNVACDIPLGKAIFTRASISPEDNCLPPLPFWDGSFVELTPTCDAGGNLQFKLHNKGLGNMVNDLEYVIIEDQIILMTGHFNLKANEDTTVVVNNPTGQAYWMQSAQSPGQTSLDLPAAFADNCNNAADYDSLGLQLPVNEADLFVSEHCGLVQLTDTASAWLEGFPLGWKDKHEIADDQEVEYIIHFQNNTGSTVQVISIRDSLPEGLLDLRTLRPGASSHPYDWELSDKGLLYFRMTNAGLEDGANGFVSFKITPQPWLPPETRIDNQTRVRFDYSPVITTNTTFHTIRGGLVDDVAPVAPGVNIKVVPNPFRQQTTIVLNGWNRSDKIDIVVTDPFGRLIKTDHFVGNQYPLEAVRLAGGTYFFKLYSAGKSIATGRFIVIP